MSEKHIPKFEHHESKEQAKNVHEANEKLREAREQAAAQAEQSKPSVEKIRDHVERNAQSKDKIAAAQTSERTTNELPLYSGASLRKQAAKRMQTRVQKQLSKPDRAFSKVIHQPAVEAISNAAEGTVARPSGLLFGGLFSAVSSLTVLYICRHYGYEYNFAIGLAFFVGGFFAGLIIEMLYKIIFFKKRRAARR